jgi:hypothetical protein
MFGLPFFSFCGVVVSCSGKSFSNCSVCEHRDYCDIAALSECSDSRGDCGICLFIECENNYNRDAKYEASLSSFHSDFDVSGEQMSLFDDGFDDDFMDG